MTKQNTIVDSLPTTIAVQLKMAAQTINKMQLSLDQARRTDKMFAGEGRYEAEWICGCYGSTLQFFAARDEAFAVFSKWEAIAAAKGIEVDWSTLKQELGIPSTSNEIWVSSEGFAYANDLRLKTA